MKFHKVTTGFCQSHKVTDSLAMQSPSYEIVTAADVAPYMEVTTTCYTLKGVGSRGLTAFQECRETT